MKKISLLLSLLLLVFTAAAASQPADLTQEEAVLPGIRMETPAQVKQNEALTRSQTPFPKPNDEVSIENGVFRITSHGVTLELQVPFGWIGLSQDISLQLMDYALMNDPLDLLNIIISNNISLLAVEPETNVNMLALIDLDAISALISNMDTDEMVDIVLKNFGGEAVKAGERSYIRLMEDDSLIYFTYYNGARVTFQLYLQGAEPTEEEIENLTAFVESTNYL